MLEALSENSKTNLISMRSYSLISQIGNTPLIEIQNLPISSKISVFAKAEFLNPSGSVKDRAALSIIQNALEKGLLDRSKYLLDASSGNTGIAYAMITASIGLKSKICIPSNASKERLNLLSAYGAELVLTDPLEGTDGAILKAREIAQENPEKYYYADQYSNESNWRAHYENTANEIFDNSNQSTTHFIAGLGTSGTFMGTSRKLKELNPSIKCISFQPDSPFHGLEGLKHMETAIVPAIYDESLADDNIVVSTKKAYEMTQWLAKKQGIMVGISSGASIAAILSLTESIEEGVIVTVFPDRGDRYLSENIWRNEYGL